MKKKPQTKQKNNETLTKEQIVNIVNSTVQQLFIDFVQSSYGFKLGELSTIKGRIDNITKDMIEIGQFARTMNSTYENVLKVFMAMNKIRIVEDKPIVKNPEK